MKESIFNTQMTHFLIKRWYWPITGTDAFVCERCKHVTRPKKGRPDILVMNPHGQSIVVECKMVPPAARKGASPVFQLDSITLEQRMWLSNFEKAYNPHKIIPVRTRKSYLALCTSTGTSGSHRDPRRAWLIPWQEWTFIEQELNQVKLDHGSIPLWNKPSQPRELQDTEFCLVNKLEEYELEWVKKEGWTTWHSTHPLWLTCNWLTSLEAFKAMWEED